MDYRTLHMKTVVELRQLAKELKVKVPAATPKSRLVELVLEGQLAAAAQANERAARKAAEAAAAPSPAPNDAPDQKPDAAPETSEERPAPLMDAA